MVSNSVKTVSRQCQDSVKGKCPDLAGINKFDNPLTLWHSLCNLQMKFLIISESQCQSVNNGNIVEFDQESPISFDTPLTLFDTPLTLLANNNISSTLYFI